MRVKRKLGFIVAQPPLTALVVFSSILLNTFKITVWAKTMNQSITLQIISFTNPHLTTTLHILNRRLSHKPNQAV